MKQNLLYGLFIAIVLFFAVSCKKASTNNSSTDYYVKVKKGGTWTSYPVTAGELGPDLGNAALTDLGVAAQTANGNERLDLSVQVKGTTFATGAYSSDNTNYRVIISLYIQNGSAGSYAEIDDAPGMAHSKYTINITSITTDALTGTFTGNYLFDAFASTTATTDITEGEFHVKRIR